MAASSVASEALLTLETSVESSPFVGRLVRGSVLLFCALMILAAMGLRARMITFNAPPEAAGPIRGEGPAPPAADDKAPPVSQGEGCDEPARASIAGASFGRCPR